MFDQRITDKSEPAKTGDLTYTDVFSPQGESFRNSKNGLTGKSSSDNLIEKGTLPALTIEQTLIARGPSHRDQRWTDTDRAIFHRIESLSAGNGARKMHFDDMESIHNLNPDERKLYTFCLGKLQDLKDSKTDPAQYMNDVMKKASDIAGNDAKKYADLVGMAFSASDSNSKFENWRTALGAGPHKAGSLLEEIYDAWSYHRNDWTGGFNQNVVDHPDNTITHHYGEFLRIGFHRGKAVADAADLNLKEQQVRNHPDPTRHPVGDIRNGAFAAMIGEGLAHGKILPKEAAALTSWAFTLHPGKSPMWGDIDTGKYKMPGQFSLDQWLFAYRHRNDK